MRTTGSSSGAFYIFYGASMLKRPSASSLLASPVRKSDFVITQEARAAALEKADSERARKRRENDALLDVNASKWRYESRRQ